MRIIHAKVENFKRIVVATITPTPSGAVEITGKNKQGKSSVLDAIEAALGGKRRQPVEPIRRGQKKARVVLELGDLVVERVWTDKSDRLVVKSREGAVWSKGQAKLDELVGGLAFDPLSFIDLPPAEQRAQLLQVLGVDLAGFDARREAVYDERRDVGRDLRQAEAELAAAEEPEGEVPEEEVSIQEVSEELEEANRQVFENEKARRGLSTLQDTRQRAERALESREEEVEAAREALRRAKEKRDKAEEEVQAAVEEEAEAAALVDTLADPDVASIKARLEGAEELNRKVRRRQAREVLARRVEKLRAAVEMATGEIEAIDQEKVEALEAADMPVEGLEVGDDGVLYNGLPLDQASLSERVRVCTALGAALNPELRIALIRQGNDLDRETLEEFYAACEEADLQAWVERIEPTLESALVIEEGRVVGGVGDEDEDGKE